MDNNEIIVFVIIGDVVFMMRDLVEEIKKYNYVYYVFDELLVFDVFYDNKYKLF